MDVLEGITHMDLGLSGKIALVTGSSRGIGRGIALTLGRQGCDLMLTGRDAAALDEVAAGDPRHGRRAQFGARFARSRRRRRR